MSKIKTKLISCFVVAMLMLASMVCINMTVAFGQENAGGGWTSLNSSTKVEANKISSGETAATNDYLAKYEQTINLDAGFKLDFTMDSFSGSGAATWPEITTTDNICFALTGAEASTTAQKAYIFAFSKKPNENNVLFYTCYSVNFAINAGVVSYTSRDGGAFDNTTGNGSFDITTPWVAGMQMSLAGDIVNGIPMFWTNDSMVNPMGDEAAYYESEGASAAGIPFQKYLTDFYKSFTINTSAMHLYAFNTSAAANESKFGINVDSVTKPYSAVENGWVATDKAVANIETAKEVTFSEIKTVNDNNLSRTRFIYDGIIDLDEKSIEFSYSTNKAFTPGGFTSISIRGVGMDQFTTSKRVEVQPGKHADYEKFLFNGGATIGVYDNATRNKAQGKGIHETAESEITAATATADWATWKVRFEQYEADKWQYTVNGTVVSQYTRAQLEAVLGADLKAELLITPNAKAGSGGASYKLGEVSSILPDGYYAADFDKGATEGIEFTATALSGNTITLITNGTTELDSTSYTVRGEKITFSAAYLNTLGYGTQKIKAELSDKKVLNFTVTILGKVTISETTGDTTKNVRAFDKDVTFKVGLSADDTIASVAFNSSTLKASAEGLVTITKEQLNKLHFGVYSVVVTSVSGASSKFDVTINKVSSTAPTWGEGQATAINADATIGEPITLKVDIKDGADYYVTLNGKELSESEAVFSSDKTTVTLTTDIVKKLAITNNTIVLHTDGGASANITITAAWELPDWSLVGNAVKAPVKNDKGEILMTGSTTLKYKDTINLRDGFTFNFLFGEVFDSWNVTKSIVEFELQIEQGNSKYLIYFRTLADGSPEQNFKTVQFIQQVHHNGKQTTNDEKHGEVPFAEIQTFSIKLLDQTILTMFNHFESRPNGMSISDIGEQAFDQASVLIKFNTSSSHHHKDDSEGTLVSMGAFNEEIKKMPTWAKPYFLPALAAPVVKVEGNKILWEALDGASQYIIYINGEPQDIVENATEFDFSDYGIVGDTLSIQVKAIGDKMTFGDSELSEVIEATIEEPKPEETETKKKGCNSKNSAAAAAAVGSVLLFSLGFIIKKK